MSFDFGEALLGDSTFGGGADISGATAFLPGVVTFKPSRDDLNGTERSTESTIEHTIRSFAILWSLLWAV